MNPTRPASRSTASIRMFESDLLEALSKIPFWVPMAIFLPVFGWMTWSAFASGISTLNWLACFAGGLVIWTATEYFLHRFVFHWTPPGKVGERLHFIWHGVHHDHPNDAMRLVMPPSVSVPLAYGFYCLFGLAFAGASLKAVFGGFILGYVVYDTLHYTLHHSAFQQPLFKRLKTNHMQHHFVTPHVGYGVSSPLWDVIMGTRRKPSTPTTVKAA